MLRNRSRAVSGKQALMADHTSQSSSSSSSYTKPVPNSLFGSPRFRAFAAMGFSFSEAPQMDQSLISPTSVLDPNPFFPLQNPFSFDKKNGPSSIFSGNKQRIAEAKAQAIGLALIEEEGDSRPSKSVIFGAKLRVQIPTPAPDSAVEKTGELTVEEMEDCEEYTCVRRHGPNAKITHIFDNCVVKSFGDCGADESMAAPKNKNMNKKKKKTKGFLSFCYTCKNDLHHTDDIYIYRGEKAFCSHECRHQEMLLDEEEDSS